MKNQLSSCQIKHCKALDSLAPRIALVMSPARMPTEVQSSLSTLLTLAPAERDEFVGRSQSIGTPNLYGGQVISQALIAACRTVESDRSAHSLHSYFFSPGIHDEVRYQVYRIRDGKSFSTRGVLATQRGKELFEATVSFHVPEKGVAHQIDMGCVVGPEELKCESTQWARIRPHLPAHLQSNNVAPIGIEYRRVEPFELHARKPDNELTSIWIRPRLPLPNDPIVHQAALAYASDHGLLMMILPP